MLMPQRSKARLFKIILIIIQFDRLLSAMSSSKQNNRQKRRNRKIKKEEQGQENKVQVGKAMQNLQYPSHLSQVNYLSIGNLQTTIEDYITHQVYYQVIMENQDHFAGKTILHITEGVNCLYSIFAARAGGKKIYCVINFRNEREKRSVFMMREVIKENRLQDQIEVLLWSDFNAKVDVIIAQPMGYCLHFDGLLQRVVEARDRFLNKGGSIFPNTLSFKCAALHDEYFSDQKVEYWDDVYGIPMKSMKKWIAHEPLIRAVDPALIVSKVAKILTFNLEEVTLEEIEKIDRHFQVELLGPCSVNGVTCWFEAFFGHLAEKKEIKGTPWGQCTKYSQVTLYWPHIVKYQDGGKLRIRLKGQKHQKQGFTVLSTEVNGQVYQYSFS